jgi:hypothetical protein
VHSKRMLADSGCGYRDIYKWRVRFFTIETLDKLKYTKLSDLLPKIILNDLSHQVKIEAIGLMGNSGDTRNISFLENLMTQKEFQNSNLSKTITIALSKLGSKPYRRPSP